MAIKIDFLKSQVDERSKKLGKNTLLLIVCQVVGIVVSFLIVPLTLNHLGVSEYGIWITLVGIIEWFNFFDIGLGHGLRNKYAEAKAKNEYDDLKKYVSTTFFMMLIISVSIFLLFSAVTHFVEWSVVLNAPSELGYTLKNLSIILIGMFCIRFVVNLISVLLTADQNPAIPAIITASGSLLSLGLILMLIYSNKVNLITLGICMSISQLLPLVFAYFYFFKGIYNSVTPKIIHFSRKHLNEIFSFGGKFFLIQITALLLLQSNNIIIAQVCGLKEVTSFNIGMKYFNVLNTLFMTMVGPLWSATTDAYFKKDFDWIKKTYRKFDFLWYFLFACGIIMFFLSGFAYKIWLGNKISPDYLLMILLLLNILFLMRSTLFRSFMNGVGKIKLQFLVTFVQSLLHIPVIIFLGKFYGIYGIVFVMFTWNFINSIWEYKQYKLILNNKATGLWNK
ncbi:lipopolysaccharide biosynthesis protein [Sphingobacterium sp. UBA6320]|uniref:lipopolysaccharide biosynthesis protein n=1 Tax=Sphingobacterium sp. UBA6320 TaxID=1947510 RepID=UPI0025E8DA1B|nr:oligosaccharide flippase family protein [Sphingobacterium sp. UBA6320]